MVKGIGRKDIRNPDKLLGSDVIDGNGTIAESHRHLLSSGVRRHRVGQARVDELGASCPSAWRTLGMHVGRVQCRKCSHLVVVPVYHLACQGRKARKGGGGKDGGREQEEEGMGWACAGVQERHRVFQMVREPRLSKACCFARAKLRARHTLAHAFCVQGREGGRTYTSTQREAKDTLAPAPRHRHRKTDPPQTHAQQHTL